LSLIVLYPASALDDSNSAELLRKRLYKIYRLLCEYVHFEFFRTIAYPALGVEAPSELEKRRTLFLKITVAAALSLPSFAHCPPSCGFDDDHFEKISRLRDEAWQKIQTAAVDEI